jgi:soluble lytic murein transglycosylase-like protein
LAGLIETKFWMDGLATKIRYRLGTTLFFWVATVMVLVLTAPAVRADIYKFIDSQGVLHFTNVPISSGYELFIKEKPQETESFSDKYDFYIIQASRAHNIDFSLLKAVIKAESNFNPKAVSHKGAKGLMQIMPGNYKKLEIEDPFDPHQNIMGGARYLKLLLQQFEGKLPLALAAYNAGPGAVGRYNNRIPPYPETQNYIKRVMNFYHLLSRQL